jgi:hypothetical protein
MVRYTDVYSDQEIKSIVAEQNENIDMNLLKDRKIGRYGIKVASSSSSPTARYAKFMSIMEIAKMYPDQIGPEVLIENSDMANKEEILQKVTPAPQPQEPAKSKPQSKAENLKFSKDYVNILS